MIRRSGGRGRRRRRRVLKVGEVGEGGFCFWARRGRRERMGVARKWRSERADGRRRGKEKNVIKGQR
jgi:hypothetical protein